MDLFVILNIKF